MIFINVVSSTMTRKSQCLSYYKAEKVDYLALYLNIYYYVKKKSDWKYLCVCDINTFAGFK